MHRVSAVCGDCFVQSQTALVTHWDLDKQHLGKKGSNSQALIPFFDNKSTKKAHQLCAFFVDLFLVYVGK